MKFFLFLSCTMLGSLRRVVVKAVVTLITSFEPPISFYCVGLLKIVNMAFQWKERGSCLQSLSTLSWLFSWP